MTFENTIKNVMTNVTNNFIKRVNVINAQFRSFFSRTNYKLFKTFCMPTGYVQLRVVGLFVVYFSM